MELEITKINGKGNAKEEYVILKANQKTNLRNFILLDNSYKYETLSNIFRHAYWFPSIDVSAGDTVWLYTGTGTDTKDILHWGSDHAIWNDSGDKATLLKIEDYQNYRYK